MEDTNREGLKQLVREYLEIQFENGIKRITAKEVKKGLNIPIFWEDLEAVLDKLKEEKFIDRDEQTKEIIIIGANGD